jgi:hypothetical protein
MYYEGKEASPKNPFEPFVSRLDWEFAHWVKTSGVGDTVLTKLLKIPEVHCLLAQHTSFVF